MAKKLKQYCGRLLLEYFRFCAKIQLKKNPGAVIIGVTGSAGKTSTRAAIAQVLRTHGKIKESVHANSETGIPLNILGLRPHSYSLFDWIRLIIGAPVMLACNWEHYTYYIVEMGINSPDTPKNMSYLLKIIQPHIGVILGVGLSHTEAFDQLVKDHDPIRRSAKLRVAIAKEKMLLAKSLSPRGVAIINIDQKELVKERRDIMARQITIGKSEKANLQILQTDVGRGGFNLKMSYQGQIYQLRLPDLFPEVFAYTFAAAIAVGAALGIAPTASIPALSDYRAPAGRFRIFAGQKGSTIIDSSYNASPDTMLQSLKHLKQLGGRGKKIAVVGDMRELGESEKSAHKNLADWLSTYTDEAILFGGLTKKYVLPVLISRKFPVHHFDTMISLNKYLRSILKPKSFVLVKGSQNTILLERAVAAILENKDDTKLLCRRGSYWDKVRAKTS